MTLRSFRLHPSTSAPLTLTGRYEGANWTFTWTTHASVVAFDDGTRLAQRLYRLLRHDARLMEVA